MSTIEHSQISVKDLLVLENKIEEGDYILLDVRERREFESEHIPLATLMSISELDKRWRELDPEKNLVLYCRSGVRSRRAANLLASKGFKNISILDGGLNHWRIERGSMEKR
ncbi:MAG: rhodanese-like domain-containing protein [Euryarchaeota archaeon]|nr:rhodanese-like domain-containing protein [Euryarchaeota archaeon]